MGSRIRLHACAARSREERTDSSSSSRPILVLRALLRRQSRTGGERSKMSLTNTISSEGRMNIIHFCWSSQNDNHAQRFAPNRQMRLNPCERALLGIDRVSGMRYPLLWNSVAWIGASSGRPTRAINRWMARLCRTNSANPKLSQCLTCMRRSSLTGKG